MTIEQLKIEIENKVKQNVEILSIYKTGGHLFCTNCNDEDYVVIIDIDKDIYFGIWDNINKIDYIIYSKSMKEKELRFERPCLYIICELFKKETTIYGDSTIYLDLLGNAEAYKKMLREKLSRSWLHPRIRWKNWDKYCIKTFWYVIIGLMMIENNSYEITEEMRTIIQQCHDCVLPKSWEDWVRERINLK